MAQPNKKRRIIAPPNKNVGGATAQDAVREELEAAGASYGKGATSAMYDPTHGGAQSGGPEVGAAGLEEDMADYKDQSPDLLINLKLKIDHLTKQIPRTRSMEKKKALRAERNQLMTEIENVRMGTRGKPPADYKYKTSPWKAREKWEDSDLL